MLIHVAELWLIDPDEPQATMLRTTVDVPDVYVDAHNDLTADENLTTPQLPGFAVRVAALTER